MSSFMDYDGSRAKTPESKRGGFSYESQLPRPMWLRVECINQGVANISKSGIVRRGLENIANKFGTPAEYKYDIKNEAVGPQPNNTTVAAQSTTALEDNAGQPNLADLSRRAKDLAEPTAGRASMLPPEATITSVNEDIRYGA